MVETAELRAWLQDERSWGVRAGAILARQRRRLAAESSGLDRFAVRMALVELTGSVSAWADGLHRGLLKWGQSAAAEPFALRPPFASAEPTAEDYERIGDYLAERVELLGALLAAGISEQ
jgi:hypothetical protein